MRVGGSNAARTAAENDDSSSWEISSDSTVGDGGGSASPANSEEAREEEDSNEEAEQQVESMEALLPLPSGVSTIDQAGCISAGEAQTVNVHHHHYHHHSDAFNFNAIHKHAHYKNINVDNSNHTHHRFTIKHRHIYVTHHHHQHDHHHHYPYPLICGKCGNMNLSSSPLLHPPGPPGLRRSSSEPIVRFQVPLPPPLEAPVDICPDLEGDGGDRDCGDDENDVSKKRPLKKQRTEKENQGEGKGAN